MKQLADILADLGDTDITLGVLREMAETSPDDRAIPVNIDAVAKRRRDLDRRLQSELAVRQFDLVRFQIERDNGAPAPAAVAALSILLFQEITTAVFDAIRDGPKQHYAPSTENAELSAMNFAGAPADSRAIALAIPNERLLAIRSDLDLAFELVFALLRPRPAGEVKRFAERTGVSAVVKVHLWAEHAARQRLTTAIGWRKSMEMLQGVTLTSRDATALQRAIEATSDDIVEEIEIEGRLLGLDETRGTFRMEIAEREVIEGLLDDSFPRGKAWPTNTWLIALLTRAARLSYAWGTERVRWTLRGLIRAD